MRRFFEICHFVTANREALEQQFELQHRALPAWYPADMWLDTVQSVEAIDIVPLAVPVYQKYWSEQVTQNAIRLFVTPAGQALVAKMYGEEKQYMGSGDTAESAQRKAILTERSQEDADIHRMLNSMTTQESARTEAFARSAEWVRLNKINPQISQEFRAVYLAKQNEVIALVARKHEAALHRSVDAYRAAHPEDKTFDESPAP